MPSRQFLEKRGGGGGRDRSFSSSSKTLSIISSSPKPTPAPKPAPASPPTSNPLPVGSTPAHSPSDSNAEGKPSKGKSGKKFPTLPQVPKWHSPKHHGQSNGDYIDSPQPSSNKGISHCGKSCDIGIGATLGAVLLAVVLVFLFYRHRRNAKIHGTTCGHDQKAGVGQNKDVEMGAQKVSAEPPKRLEPACLRDRCIDRESFETAAAWSTEERAEGNTAIERQSDNLVNGKGPPCYMEEERGVGHCEDPEKPCMSASEPHFCSDRSAGTGEAGAQKHSTEGER